MAEVDHELLVLLDAGRAAEAVAGLRAVGEVRQQLPPRLALVVAPGGAADVSGVVGVLGVFSERPPPDDVMAAMNGAEQLFVRGWVERAGIKHRPGDGAGWSDPPYLPPDPPPSS